MTHETAWQALARWANERPRPQPPELVPGLPAENQRRLLIYREQLVAWKVGKAEARMFGLTQ